MTAVASDRFPFVPEPVGRTGPSPTPATAPTRLRIYGIAADLGSLPLEELERRSRAVTAEQIRTWFSQFPGTREVAVLSTCHRVELVLLARSSSEVDHWLRVLPGSPRTWQVREGSELFLHLFRVAAGRESLALGEAEVRQQVRAAGRSVESRHPRPMLAELFSTAAAAAEETAPSGPSLPSVARVAATLVRELLDRRDPRVLVVGTGAVGRQVAEDLAGAAQITVVYRARPPPSEFLDATGARPVPLDALPAELRSADAVVTAIKSGSPCLPTSELPRDRPLLLVDLGLPRNIDPAVRSLPNVRLVDLEELHARFARSPADSDQDARVARLAGAYWAGVHRRLGEPWVDAWLRSAEAVRREEFANARRFWGALTPEQEAAVGRLTERLVKRLLLPPARRLRSLPAGPDGDRERELALRLLRPDPDGS